jgi:predicted dehydrogenase
VELAAVMDPVPGRAQAVAEEYEVRLAFEDYGEMLQADIDAVVIASPIFVHHEQVMKAIDAGKRLQIQKTMTSTLAEANDVVEATRVSDVVDCILNRKAPVVTVEHARHLIEIIEKGYISATTGQAQDIASTFELPQFGG